MSAFGGKAEPVMKDDEVSLKLLAALLITSGSHSFERAKALKNS
jgi:hypothetical protein